MTSARVCTLVHSMFGPLPGADGRKQPILDEVQLRKLSREARGARQLFRLSLAPSDKNLDFGVPPGPSLQSADAERQGPHPVQRSSTFKQTFHFIFFPLPIEGLEAGAGPSVAMDSRKPMVITARLPFQHGDFHRKVHTPCSHIQSENGLINKNTLIPSRCANLRSRGGGRPASTLRLVSRMDDFQAVSDCRPQIFTWLPDSGPTTEGRSGRCLPQIWYVLGQ